MADSDRHTAGTWQDSLDPVLVRRIARRRHPGVVPLDIVHRILGWVEYLEKRTSLANEIARRRGVTSGAFGNHLPIVHAQWPNDEDEPAARGPRRSSPAEVQVAPSPADISPREKSAMLQHEQATNLSPVSARDIMTNASVSPAPASPVVGH